MSGGAGQRRHRAAPPRPRPTPTPGHPRHHTWKQLWINRPPRQNDGALTLNTAQPLWVSSSSMAGAGLRPASGERRGRSKTDSVRSRSSIGTSTAASRPRRSATGCGKRQDTSETDHQQPSSHVRPGAAGPFDGLAHEPWRHGVQLGCVVFPGCFGGLEVSSSRPDREIGTG